MVTSRLGGFFTAAEAARIARLPRSTVDYWARTGLVTASQRHERPRLYAFADLRDLVTARKLRDELHVKLPRIREALATIRDIDDQERLAQAELAVIGDRMFYRNRTRGVEPIDVGPGGQRVLAVTMASIFDELGVTDPDVPQLRPAPGVLIDPRVRGGTPVVDGTRIPTQLIAMLDADGMSPADIVDLYPSLMPQQVADALAYERSEREPHAMAG